MSNRAPHRVLAIAALTATILSMIGCQRLDALLHANRCVLSDRVIHANMAVRIAVDSTGKRGDACCLRCALSYAIQTHRTVRILSVTDFNSRRWLRPLDAFYVVGSKVQPCSAPRNETTANRSECVVLSWDRCDPSIIAFASKDAAERFRSENGGQVETFQQVTRSAPKGIIRFD